MQPDFHDPFVPTQSPFGPDKADEKKRIPWWAWFFVILCGAIPVVALGGAIPVLIGIGGVSACLAVARSLRASPFLGALMCLGISVACWIGFAVLLVVVVVLRGGDPVQLARQFFGQDQRAAQQARRDGPRRAAQGPGPNRSWDQQVPNPANSLTLAVRLRDLQAAQRALEGGADPNTPEQGKYPLVMAIEARHHEMASLLLEEGAKANRPADPQFPLGVALQARDDAMIELLIKHGADPNGGTIQGQSLLGYALGRGWNETAEQLARHGARLSDAKPGHFVTAVHNNNPQLLRAILDSGYSFTVNDTAAIEHLIRQEATETINSLLKHGLPVDLQSPSGQPLLHTAVVAKRPEIVQSLLKHGADPNQTNRAGETPLSLAARSRDIATTSLLLGSKARVNELDSMGKTALHHAVMLEAPQVAELLVKNGANVHQADRSGTTPLVAAVSRANQQVLRNLLVGNPDLNQGDKTGRTALHHAVNRRDPEIVALLIAKGASLNVVDKSKNTPLAIAVGVDLEIASLLAKHGAAYSADASPIPAGRHAGLRKPFLQAAEEGYSAVVAALLDAGIPVDLADSRLKEQAIHKAAAAGQREVVRLLLERGADCDAPDTRCETPLFLALREEHEDVAELLTQAGADALRRLPNNGTLLHLAARIDHPDLVRKLLELGVDIEATDGVGRTPLLWAADSDSNRASAALIEAGARIDVTEGSSATLVEVAVRRGNEALAELLMGKGASVTDNRVLFQAISSWRGNDRLFKSVLDHGAGLETVNNLGETPLLYAVRNRRFDAAKILLDAGARVDVTDKNGRTPLDWATRHQHAELIELLRSKTK